MSPFFCCRRGPYTAAEATASAAAAVVSRVSVRCDVTYAESRENLSPSGVEGWEQSVQLALVCDG